MNAGFEESDLDNCESPMSDPLTSIEQNLFFIVGCGRSGTTLFKTMLNAHPEICIPHETMFFSGISKGLETPDISLKQKVQRIVDRWWIRDMGVDGSSIEEALEGREASWRNLFLALLKAASPGCQASRFGEKTVGHVRHAESLLDEFESSRVLQIIRDPRASFASFRKATVGSNQVAPLIRDWSYSAELDCRLTDNPRYLRIRFEDLVNQTQDTLAAVCHHLDLEFDEAMLQFHQRDDKGFSPDQTHHENTAKPIFKTGLSRWKQELKPSQIGLIEYRLSGHMERLGYELEGVTVTFPEARMLFSQAVDYLARLFIRRPMAQLQSFRAKRRQCQTR